MAAGIIFAWLSSISSSTEANDDSHLELVLFNLNSTLHGITSAAIVALLLLLRTLFVWQSVSCHFFFVSLVGGKVSDYVL
jgi:hypothetical protein